MLPTRIRVTFDPEPRRARGKAREVFRAGMGEQANFWHRTMAPNHFKSSAFAKYGYRGRSANYRKRKSASKKAGIAANASLPLVYSGLTRSTVEGLGSIQAFPTRANLSMYTPAYVKIRPRGNRPNLYQELTRVVRSEVAELDKNLAKNVDRGLRAIKAPRTVTIGH